MTASAKLRTLCPGHKRYRRGCDGCRASNTAWKRNRGRAIAYGRWAGNVDAAETRAHIEALVASGLSLRSISVRANMAASSANRVLTRSQVRASTAAAILAITGGAEVAS